MPARSPTPTVAIRLVVGGNAILQAGAAHVLVYADTAQTPAAILLPPRQRWQACIAADFPASYDEVLAAIAAAGHAPVITEDAAVSSTTARA